MPDQQESQSDLLYHSDCTQPQGLDGLRWSKEGFTHYFLVPAFEYAIDQTVYGNRTIYDTLTLVAAWFMWSVLTGVLLFGVQLILRPCKQYLSQKFSSRT